MSDYALRFFNAQPAVSEDRSLVEFPISDGVVPNVRDCAVYAELIKVTVEVDLTEVAAPSVSSQKAHFRKSRKSRFLNRLA